MSDNSDFSDTFSDNEWDDCEEVDDWGDYEEVNEWIDDNQQKIKENKDTWNCCNCGSINTNSKKMCLYCNMPDKKVINSIIYDEKMIECKKCGAFLFEYEYYYHSESCSPLLNESRYNKEWFVPLTDKQKKSLQYIHKVAEIESEKMKPELLKKIIRLGYTEKHLDNLLKYIEYEFPIVIHFKEQSLKFFINDTHYRNLFEIGRGNGGNHIGVRNSAEVKLFGNIYNSFTPFERVKYGCFNFRNEKTGCPATCGYGRSVLTLNKKTTRWRVTFSNSDSFFNGCVTGTLNNCCHVLNKFNNDKLLFLLKLANGLPTSYRENSYTEIQIHGPLRFENDIKSVYISKQPIADNIMRFIQNKERNSEIFCKKNKIDLIK